MGKYGDLIGQIKAEPESPTSGDLENQTAGNPEIRKARKPDGRKSGKRKIRKAVQPESRKAGDLVNVGAKVPRAWQRHWAIQAKIEGVSMTDVIIEALTKKFGKPE